MDTEKYHFDLNSNQVSRSMMPKNKRLSFKNFSQLKTFPLKKIQNYSNELSSILLKFLMAQCLRH